MSDIIERLLEVEQQARGTIEEAEEEADRILGEAREKAREIREEGQKAARRKAEELLKTNDRALQQERQQRIEQEKQKLLDPRSVDEETIERAARFAADLIAFGERRAQQ